MQQPEAQTSSADPSLYFCILLKQKQEHTKYV